MLLLTLRETYALNRLSSFKNLRRNLTTALGGQRPCYATAVRRLFCSVARAVQPNGVLAKGETGGNCPLSVNVGLSENFLLVKKNFRTKMHKSSAVKPQF